MKLGEFAHSPGFSQGVLVVMNNSAFLLLCSLFNRIVSRINTAAMLKNRTVRFAAFCRKIFLQDGQYIRQVN